MSGEDLRRSAWSAEYPARIRSVTWSDVADAIWLAGHKVTAAGPDEHAEHSGTPTLSSGPAEHDAKADAVPRPDGEGADATGDDPKIADTTTAHPPSRHPDMSFGDRVAGRLVAGPAPLPERRLFERALRPLKRVADSHLDDRELDEDATAVRAAQDGLWLPETRPVRERWLELDVVVDDGRLASIHHPLIKKFVECLTAVGAFRAVRTHLWDTDARGPDASRLREPGPMGEVKAGAGLAGRGLRDRSLIMVLTDGTGHAWHAGAAQRMLALWGRRCPVVLVNTLARRQWRRTALVTRPAKLFSDAPAAANGRYAVLYPRSRDPGGGLVPSRDRSLSVHIPVIELTPAQLVDWAGFVSGAKRGWFGAVAVCTSDPAGEAEPGTRDPPSSERVLMTPPAELVRRFRAAVSPAVYALSVHLAAAPLSTPLMRLVQRMMQPGSSTADLAEVVGSGLLQEIGRAGVIAPNAQVAEDPRDKVAFDFLPGVREELLATGLRSETTRVLLAVARHLGDEVGVLPELHDMIVAPHEAEVPVVGAGAAFFASPSISAFHALSGPYLRIARELDDRLRDIGHLRDFPAGGDTGPTDPEYGRRGRGTGHARVREVLTMEMDDSPGERIRRRVPPEPSRRPGAGGPPAIWGNVPPQNPSFTGREDLLDQLHVRLSRGTTAILPEALHGMGGVGKSQIAIEYVYRHIGDYDLVWWIRAERPGQIQQDLTDLAVQLGLPVRNEVNVAVPAVREALRLGRPYRDWLLVFDNAEVLDEAREFFPAGGPGKILITSRNRAWIEAADSLEVDVFAREESATLLRLRGPELDDEEVNSLAEVLGDLPLAIEQAAVWLSETGMPVDEYLRLFHVKHGEAAELLYDAAPAAYELPVAAAWNISLDRLRETHPAALQLLQVCAFFAPEPISWRLLSGGRRNLVGPPELLETLSDPIRLGRTVRAINQYALAKISHRHNTIMLHRLVQRVLVAQLSPEDAATLRHCGHQLLANADPANPDLPSRWQEYADLLPHIHYSDIIECADPWVRDLVLHEIEFLFNWGDHKGFLDLAERAVETWTEELGPDHEQTLSATLHLGRALRLNGRFTEAYEHHVRVRDILVGALGEEDERALEAQRYVCADLRYLGRFDQALQIDRASFESLRRRFGADDPMTLQQAHLYAIDLRLTGEVRAARDLDRDTYQRLRAIFGETRNVTLGSLAAVAVDEMECGNHEEARELTRENLERIEQTFGSSFVGLAESLSALSVMEGKAGNHARALELSTEALERYVGNFGADHPNSIGALMMHAVNLRQAGRLDDSIRLARESVVRCDTIFGSRHPNTPTARVNLAVALRLNGQIVEAKELDRAALEILKDVLGENHPRSIVCAVNLASDDSALGDQGMALERDRSTLKTAVRRLGEYHPTTLAVRLNYSLDLRAVGEAESDAHFERAIEGLLRTHGTGHPSVVLAHRRVRADCDIYPIPL